MYGNFSMNSQTGVLYMNTPPDRELINTFTITLTATDQPVSSPKTKYCISCYHVIYYKK